MNNQNPSRIVPAMKRTSLLLALIVLSALPAVAQTNEFGVMAGGSMRFVDGAPREEDVVFADSTFAFSNSVFELYWAMQLEPEYPVPELNHSAASDGAPYGLEKLTAIASSAELSGVGFQAAAWRRHFGLARGVGGGGEFGRGGAGGGWRRAGGGHGD